MADNPAICDLCRQRNTVMRSAFEVSVRLCDALAYRDRLWIHNSHWSLGDFAIRQPALLMEIAVLEWVVGLRDDSERLPFEMVTPLPDRSKKDG